MPEGSAQAPATLQLAVDDRVVYPKQGVCRVTAIDVKEVAGQRLTLVILKREEDGAVVMVPESKVASIGVRKVANREEVDRLFAFLRSDSDKADLDWKLRARTNQDRMTQGGILGLAEVVKGLQVLSELRPLPTKERELYDSARHLLVSEVAAALGTSECNAEDSIDLVLFPPGRERPKRTAEEFKLKGGDEDLELDSDLLGLDGDLDLPSDEEPAPAEEEEPAAEGEEPESEEGADEAEAPKKRGRPPKAKTAEADAAPKKRGRPPKAKPADEPAAAPKKPGRPPKAKAEPAAAAEAPKKRGRPPKAKSADAEKPAASKSAKKKS
jgi:CarD family transcriptional regulator